jgi:hypothetical protein
MILSVVFISGYSQQIPVGSCGIVNIYDAAGNRTKRVYFCNNGTDPYPARGVVQPNTVIATDTSQSPGETTEFQEVDALYPNPTSGMFSVTFSKALDNATIQVLDAGGRIMRQIKAKGYKAEFDLSADAGGVYYVRIEQDGKIITKKVVKQ